MSGGLRLNKKDGLRMTKKSCLLLKLRCPPRSFFLKLSYSQTGSCVLKASVDRVSVDTIGRYGDRHSADMSAECRLSVGRHVVLVNRPSVDTIGRYIGRHSADTSADMLRSTVASVSADCR